MFTNDFMFCLEDNIANVYGMNVTTAAGVFANQ